MKEYRLFISEDLKATSADFEIYHELIINAFPNSLNEKKEVSSTIFANYIFPDFPIGITSRKEETLVYFPLDKVKFKDSFESKTKLILEEISNAN